MAQHDYDLVNAPTLTVRSEFNSILSAVLSTNAGPLPPTQSYPGQIWLNDDLDVLSQRTSSATVTWKAMPLDTDFLPLDGGIITGNLNVTGTFSNPDFDRLRGNYVGTAPPSQPLAGMLWYDTSVSPAVLRVRNKTNSAWLVAMDMATPVFTDALTIAASGTGNVHLVLNSQGTTRYIFNEVASDRVNFWLPTSHAAALYDNGNLLLKGNNYADLATVINGLQPALGFTPIRQTGGYVPVIGGNPARLYRDGVDQGVIQYGPAPATFYQRAEVGALTYARSLALPTAPNAVVAGTQMVYQPDAANVGVGSWRNLGGNLTSNLQVSIFQRIA